MMREEVIAELERACRTLRRMEFPRHSAPPTVAQALACSLPAPPPDRNTAYGAEKERVTRERPTAADIDHWHKVWPWMFHLEQRERGIVYVKLAHDIGWRRVGRIFDCSHETARRLFDQAINRIASAI